MPNVAFPSLGSVALSGSTRVRRARSVGSIGLHSGRANGGAPWGGVSEMIGDAAGVMHTIGVSSGRQALRQHSEVDHVDGVRGENKQQRPVSRAQSAPGFAPDLEVQSIVTWENSDADESPPNCELHHLNCTQTAA
eukprot:SAG11_NODE_1395_length_5038_cov_1.168050_6_plen_136_part_00